MSEQSYSPATMTSLRWRPLRRRLSIWRRNAVTRRALAALPSERLADLGLSEAEAAREGRKWFWQD